MEENGTIAATNNAAPDSTAVSAGTAQAIALRPTRRSLMVNALTGAAFAAGAGALLAGCGSGGGTTNVIPGQNGAGSLPGPTPSATPNPTPSPTPSPLDTSRLVEADILNFALNLEYLEAEFYLRAVGQTLNTTEAGGSAAGAVTGGRAVNFTSPVIGQFINELANDERNHVNFLRTALGGAAVPRPAINFTTAFNALAQAAGFGGPFDPFTDQQAFLLGSFVFEDVGVTAYRGGARFLTTPAVVQSAAGILAVEAFHAGVVRHMLSDVGGNALNLANKVSALRAAAGGGKDEPLGVSPGFSGSNSFLNFVPAQNNAVTYSRTTAEVLRIVYLTPTGFPASGGFFPNGVNGTIKQAV